MTAFDNAKKSYLEKLYKPDKSKKGDVDTAIIPLIETINALPDFYTTSSCAGRISLLVEPESGKKYDSAWHFVTHEPTSFDEVKPHLATLPPAPVWFKMEGAILHVCARDEKSANEFLHLAREAGFKHSGLLGTSKRYLLEVIDSERIDVPVAIDGQLIVDERFVRFLIAKANAKLEETRKTIGRLKKSLAHHQ